MTYERRQRIMRAYARAAKRYDVTGGVVLRNQNANQWRALATEAEAARAPRYLTWSGRGAHTGP